LSHFQKKFKDKSGLAWEHRGDPAKNGKYVFLERSYEPDTDEEEANGNDGDDDATGPADRSRSASPAKCTLAPSVKSLMELIFNQQ
jgi:poly [ADP-ribose] polymerase